MTQLIFSTGNTMKFTNGKVACNRYGIDLKQIPLKVDEIQDESTEYIITDKAKRSFAELGQPVVVSDDSWEIPGLNGFPGAYMKYLNSWFTPENFIDLTKPLVDRRIFLQSRLAYADGKQVKLFLCTYEGYLLDEARGVSGPPSQKVISLLGDNDLSISEVYDRDPINEDRDVHKIWDTFCEWYLQKDAV
jgi:XTP/dITP diphosphohydrolase